MKISVIIAAAGAGRRFGGSVAKQYLTIDGVTLLQRALNAFSGFNETKTVDSEISEIIVASDDVSKVPSGCIAVRGGGSRQVSVNNALAIARGDCVLIHDAARPFVSCELIERVVRALEGGASSVVPCVRPKNTIRTAETSLDRDSLFEVQTPQGFKTDILKAAYKAADEKGLSFTDDAGVAEAMGVRTVIVEGDYRNIKITTADDMPGELRFGNGYDVHRLAEGRPLMLGCTHIPFGKGLLGHSDADVLAHAMADALLGAAKLGDIGRIFPDKGAGSDKTEGISGAEILKTVAEMLREKGYTVMMIDGTVIAEAPKLAPHIDAMCENIAKALGIAPGCVSVKATTEENMSDVSRNGMAAIATCVIRS